jgi:hypothetical protein
VTFALARSLLLADAVTPDGLAQALLVSATRGISLVRALLAARAIEPARLEQLLDRGDAPYMRHIAPVMSLVQHLPPGLCERLLALPVRRDPRTGTVDVAVVDARDPHPAEEIGHWLKAPVRVVRTSLATMDSALKRLNEKPEVGVRSLAPPIWVPTPREVTREHARTPMYGTPAVDRAAAEPDDDLDASPTEVHDFPAVDPNIPIPLTRKSISPVAIVEIGPPAVEREAVEPVLDLKRQVVDPVLDLKRRKTAVPLSGRAADPLSGGAPAPPGGTFGGAPASAVVRASAPPVPEEMPAASTSRGPFAPNAPGPPFEDVGPILDDMRSADDRDRILELLVAGVRTVAHRAAVLAVRRDAMVGWTCSPEMADRGALRGVKLPSLVRNVFNDAIDRCGALLVRLPKDATHAPLIAVMRTPPSRESAVVAVYVEEKAVAVVFADDLGDALVATKRMEDLARTAGEALGRLLRDRRR